jgi:hypothetical protein
MAINDPYKKIKNLKQTMEKIQSEIILINHYIQMTPSKRAFKQ